MRRLIDLLPASNTAEIPEIACSQPADANDMSLDRLIPDNANKPYDIKELIEKVVDEGDFFELQATYAGNIVIGFARVEGQSVGIIANQPNAMAGTLNIDAGEKAARFVRFCDALGFRFSLWWMFPATFLAPTKSGRGSFVGEQSCSTLTPKQAFLSSP